jgi:tRNA G37 N-methylase Trm5
MPLPEKAHSFLPFAVKALNLGCESGIGIIHYYDVSAGERKEDLFKTPIERVKSIIHNVSPSISVEIENKRVVRSVGPRKYHVVLDLKLQLKKE